MMTFFSILFSLAGFSIGHAKTLDKTVAIVNQDIILESDVENFQKKLKSKQFQDSFGGVDPKILNSREGILQLLIEEKIVNQQVKKLELSVTDNEVDGQIRSILKRNGITENQLKERLKQLGTSFSDYRDGIRKQIERRNLVDREIKPTLEVTESDLRHFYESSRALTDGGAVAYTIAHIFVDGKDSGARKKVDSLYATLQGAPDQYETLAKESSDDDSSRDQGGKLGTFSFEQLAPEFKAYIPKTQVGKFTPPIKTKAGYHIVKILEKKNSDFASLPKERKEALRNQMMTDALEKKMAQWLERKRGESYIKIN